MLKKHDELMKELNLVFSISSLHANHRNNKHKVYDITG